MLYIVIGIFCAIYGIRYALDPMDSLKKKFKDEEIPKASVYTARISGVVIAAAGVVIAVVNYIKL